MLKKFPQLENKRLWADSYFIATAGNISSETMRKYVEEQWVREKAKRKKGLSEY
jgi:putative transposase